MKLRYERLTGCDFQVFDGEREIAAVVVQPVDGGFLFAFWPPSAFWCSPTPNREPKPIHFTAANIRIAVSRFARTFARD